MSATKRDPKTIPFEQFKQIQDMDKVTAQNKQIVQSARRPQPYVQRGKIATGTDKARLKGFRSMREHWSVSLTKKGWTDAVKGINKPSGGEPAIARINHGRWDAVCPDPQCSGGEVVDPNDPVFMCLSCGNVANRVNGVARLRPVEFPAQSEQKLIEKPLLQRPRINRNWDRSDTHIDLWKENIENSDELYEGSEIPKAIAEHFGWSEEDGVVNPV